MGGLLIASVLLVGLVGLLLVAAGLRGRRVNDHPVCSSCTFDLVGVYPASATCPECGADLGRKAALRRGVRVRSTRLVVAGMPLLAIAAGAVGLVAWSIAAGTAWYPRAPGWYLEIAAEVGSAPRRAAAVGELAGRHTAGTLDPGRADRLVRRGIAIQADPDAPWLTEWGDLIDSAEVRGDLSPEQRASYLRHACRITLDAHERVRSGDEAQVSLAITPHRTGSATSIVVSVGWADLLADGTVLERAYGGRSRMMLRGTGGRSANSRTIHFDLPPGRVELSTRPQIELGTQFTAGWDEIIDPIPFESRLATSVEVLASDAPLVRFDDRPELLEEMLASIAVRSLRVRSRGEGWVELKGDIGATSPPASFGCEAFIIGPDGAEHPFASMFFPAGGHHSYGTSGRIEGELGPTVDVVLRTSERAVLSQSLAAETWVGELRIEGVPISDPSVEPGAEGASD